MTDIGKKDGTVGLSKEDKAAEPATEKATMSTVEEKTTPEGEKEKPGMKGKWMYVGPTVPGIGIQNRVYTEIPAEAAGRAKEVPEVRLLFIPVKDYPMANKMLREKTGYIYDAYCKAASLRRGGGKA